MKLTASGRFQAGAGLFLAVAMAATVGAALGFQHIGGYLPCALCLKERIPYYIGAPLMLLAFASGALGWPAVLTRGLLLLGGLLMTWGLVMAVYHSGVEWKFWPGPRDCSAAFLATTKNAGSLLNDLDSVHPPACDTAAGRLLGLSFAGWNALASLILAAIAYAAAFRPARS